MTDPDDALLLVELRSPPQRAAGLALLWPQFDPEDRRRQFDSAAKGSLASWLLGGVRAGQVVAAMRVHVHAGRTATLAPPVLQAGEPRETAAELVQRAATQCRVAGAQLLHAIVPSAEGTDAELLSMGGLRHVAELLLLVSLTSRTSGEPPELGCTLSNVGTVGEDRLAAVVARTYQGSLDCQEFEGLRAIDDVLAGYRASGPFAPERWLVASDLGQDIGCLILSDTPESSQWELTYLGVVPEARGRGLGVQLVRHAQWMTHVAGRSRLVVAVDARNKPARAVYHDCGFIQWNRQNVFACAL